MGATQVHQGAHEQPLSKQQFMNVLTEYIALGLVITSWSAVNDMGAATTDEVMDVLIPSVVEDLVSFAQVSAQGAERMRPNLYEWIGDRFREYADLDPLATRQESLWLAFGKHIAASTGAFSVGAMVDLPVMSFVKQLPVERFVTQLRVRTG